MRMRSPRLGTGAPAAEAAAVRSAREPCDGALRAHTGGRAAVRELCGWPRGQATWPFCGKGGNDGPHARGGTGV